MRDIDSLLSIIRRALIHISIIAILLSIHVMSFPDNLGFIAVYGQSADADTNVFLPIVTGVNNLEPSKVTQDTEPIDHGDRYWADLAKDYPPFIPDEKQLQAASVTNVGGEWGPVIAWPHIPVSAANLPDGRILSWASNARNDFPSTGLEQTYTSTWDPVTGQFQEIFHDSHDMFCASQVMLEDGRVFVNGGRNYQNSPWTSVFDFETDSWTRLENMNEGRWYPTSVYMPSDKVFTAAGKGGGQYPELYQPGSGWSNLTGINLNAPLLNYTNHYEPFNWPLLHLSPNGEIFMSGPTPQMHNFDTAGSGSVLATGSPHTAWYFKHGATIMFEEGKLIAAGGRTSGTSGTSVNLASVIDINGSSPTVTATSSMHHARTFHNGVMLPTGELLAIGGNTTGALFSDVGTNLTAEIWNPDTGQWSLMNSMSVPRNYHSIALLLTDGRVLSAGGGLCDCAADHQDGQIFSPPYLFDSNGNLATRPTISSAPDNMGIGQAETVVATPGIQKFSLVKMSSTTHGVNTDLRFLDVPFTETASGQYSLSFNGNINVQTPGYWMLFAVNTQGVPSVAKVVKFAIVGQPIVDNPGPQINSVGDSINLAVNISDPDNDPLVVTATNLPPGLTIDNAGLIAGTVTTAGTYNVSLTVTDNNSPPIVVGFVWTVNAVASCLGLIQEGESGALAGPFVIGNDSNASGNQYVHAPVGSGGSSSADPLKMASYCVTITQSGTYRIKTNVYASSGSYNSFFVKIDNLPGNGYVWDTSINTIYSEDYLTGRGYPDPLEISLDAGNHTIDFFLREQGNRLDKFEFELVSASNNPLTVNSITSPPRPTGSPVAYNANASGGSGTLQYRWLFGDGTPETAQSTASTVNHTYSQPGRYIVRATVSDATGQEVITEFYQAIHQPFTANRPSHSTSVAYEERTGDNRLWNVNPDNDSVSIFNVQTHQKVQEITVGIEPRSLAIAPDGRVWAVNKHSATVSIIDEGSLSVAQTLSLPSGSSPSSIVFAPDDSSAYIALESTGKLLKLNPLTGAQIASVDVGPNPRHLSINGASNRVFVSRFITPFLPNEETASPNVEINGIKYGGEVVAVNLGSMTVDNTIVLQHSDRQDSEHSGRGIPNYLGPAIISPDGLSAWVPSKQDNVLRGALRDGNPLDFDHTVRSVTSYINLSTDAEEFARRVDHDNAGVASNGHFGHFGNYIFVSLESNREIAVVDAYAINDELFRFDVGRAPQGITLSADGSRLFVHNFMDRSITVHDISALIDSGQQSVTNIATYDTVAGETLSALVLSGKQLFYDAIDPRLSQDSYMSCASCHNEGGHDGRVWDFTSVGEGLRNTIPLNGHAGTGQGRLHWSGNFDEVHDFENQIRDFAGGTGLMSNAAFNAGTRSDPLGDPKAGVSADLDALAAYISSLTLFGDSPHRNNNGTLTADGAAGRVLAENLDCASCHAGVGYTDSQQALLHDIGTLKSSSGNRSGGTLPGIDTPTLRGVWNSAPYLHDGSATTLAAAINDHSGISVSGNDLNQLVAFLNQIDDSEPPLGANAGNCGGLIQEGEQGDLTGQFTIGTDSAASGGAYTHVPQSGGYATAPDPNQKASYCVTITQSGTYRIKAKIYAANGGNNSSFVQIDGLPANGHVWDTSINTAYDFDYVNSRNVADPLELTLSAGEHTFDLFLREPDNRLDWFEFELVSSNAVPGAVTQLSPNSSSTGAIPSFVWEQTNNADEYTLVIYSVDTDSVVSTTTYMSADANYCGATTCTAQLINQSLTAGLYTWLIRASNSTGDGPWSVYTP